MTGMACDCFFLCFLIPDWNKVKYKLMKQFSFCLSTSLGTKTKLLFILDAET